MSPPRRLLPGLVLGLLALGGGPSAAQTGPGGAPPVDLIKVDGVIDAPMRDYLVGGLERSERDGAVVLIQLDTPGTMGIDWMELAVRVDRATVPVVVWIGPPGARAEGSGALIAAAADLVVISPGSALGPATPLDLLRPTDRIPSGLPVDADELPREQFSPQEALDRGLADLGDPSVSIPQDVLRVVDGHAVDVGGREVTLETWDEERSIPALTRFHDLGPWRRVLHAVSGPAVIYVLLSLGLALVAFELTQSGIGVAGVGGTAMLALAGYGLAATPPWWPGMAMLLAGVAAMTADVRLRRLGALSVLGLALFAAGSITSYGGVAPAVDVSPWLIGGAVLATGLYYLFGLTVAIQSRERMASTRRGLVGLVGETRGLLAPEGPVFVKGTLWRGRSQDGPIPAGTRVRVRRIDGLVLEVRAEPEDGPQDGPQGEPGRAGSREPEADPPA
ncbi:MAG: hypothetical protein HY658_10080 [Actinobacteria bacterium]|nr:hypothetical protein [Actinomycetota bacterium]